MADQGTQPQCPYGCGYQGNSTEIEDHIIYMINMKDKDHSPEKRK